MAGDKNVLLSKASQLKAFDYPIIRLLQLSCPDQAVTCTSPSPMFENQNVASNKLTHIPQCGVE